MNSYICTSCQPFFLNALKIENNYKIKKECFEERKQSQGSFDTELLLSKEIE
jgi:hypothetical protein